MLRRTKSTKSAQPSTQPKKGKKQSMVNLREIPTYTSSGLKSFSNVESIVAMKLH